MGFLVLSLFLVLLVAIFALQNATPVSVTAFFWQLGSFDLSLVILGSALIGALLVSAFGGYRLFRVRREAEGLRRQLRQHAEAAEASAPPPESAPVSATDEKRVPHGPEEEKAQAQPSEPSGLQGA